MLETRTIEAAGKAVPASEVTRVAPAPVPAPPPTGQAAPGQAGRVNLAFLDGLRGLAALYVLLYHLYDPHSLPAGVVHGLSWLRFGHYAVAVFIVLSGYCLMLPVVRAPDGQLRGGPWLYLKRRATRILPPYYAALVLVLVFLALVHRGTHSLGVSTDDAAYADSFSRGSLLSHLLVLHTWNKAWNMSIDSPMWSVSTEWQIYFLFPFLLLPLWRRFGSLAAVGAGLLIGVLPVLILPQGHNFEWACPWYAGLFAMGMAGAEVGFSRKLSLMRLHRSLPWGTMAALCLSLFVGLSLLSGGTVRYGMLAMPYPWLTHWAWLTDVLAGGGTVCLLVFCAQAAHAAAPGSDRRLPLALRVLESRGAIALGAFSYSLYLIHYPLVVKVSSLTHRYFAHGPHAAAKAALATFAVGLPLSLGAAFLFHLLFERPFMAEHRARLAAGRADGAGAPPWGWPQSRQRDR